MAESESGSDAEHYAARLTDLALHCTMMAGAQVGEDGRATAAALFNAAAWITDAATVAREPEPSPAELIRIWFGIRNWMQGTPVPRSKGHRARLESCRGLLVDALTYLTPLLSQVGEGMGIDTTAIIQLPSQLQADRNHDWRDAWGVVRRIEARAASQNQPIDPMVETIPSSPPTSMQTLVLDDVQVRILKHLKSIHPSGLYKLVTQIADTIGVDRKTCGPRLKTLTAAGLVCRPEGKPRGFMITGAGLKYPLPS